MCQKLLKSANLIRVTIDNVGNDFSGFLFISTHILLDLLSLGSAESYNGRGGKLNSHLMASCVRNTRTKNYQNLIIGFQLTVKNVGYAFLGHSVLLTEHNKLKLLHGIEISRKFDPL